MSFGKYLLQAREVLAVHGIEDTSVIKMHIRARGGGLPLVGLAAQLPL